MSTIQNTILMKNQMPIEMTLNTWFRVQMVLVVGEIWNSAEVQFQNSEVALREHPDLYMCWSLCKKASSAVIVQVDSQLKLLNYWISLVHHFDPHCIKLRLRQCSSVWCSSNVHITTVINMICNFSWKFPTLNQ